MHQYHSLYGNYGGAIKQASSYTRFKLLASLAAEKKLKIGILIALLGMPGINIAVGAALIAHFIYSSTNWIPTKYH